MKSTFWQICASFLSMRKKIIHQEMEAMMEKIKFHNIVEIEDITVPDIFSTRIRSNDLFYFMDQDGVNHKLLRVAIEHFQEYEVLCETYRILPNNSRHRVTIVTMINETVKKCLHTYQDLYNDSSNRHLLDHIREAVALLSSAAIKTSLS